MPNSVPAVSIDRQCGSSQQSIQFAAQAVLSGTQDVVIAAGVESMTRVPMGSTGKFTASPEPGSTKSPGLDRHFPGVAFSQFMGAEMLAEKYGFTRDALDAFALESHRRAARRDDRERIRAGDRPAADRDARWTQDARQR